ncbi:MAG TPA: hypothetical protein VGJ42_03850 [Nitrososphaera sp.]|jgi:hypothetical protein
MVNKFLIAIAGVVAVMAALVLVPSFNREQQQDLSIGYSRQNLTQMDDGRLVAASADDLVISNDLSASYRSLIGAPKEKEFSITSDEMSSLKGLIISTGFMQVPGTDYPRNDAATSLTEYTLKLTSGGNSKTINWVNVNASDSPVPSIVRNIGTRLDAIIKDHV